MANKRKLKKYIRFICGDLASEILVASLYDDRIDSAKVQDIIRTIAATQELALDRCTFSFDHKRRDYANDKEYRKALHAYRRQAYNKMAEDFRESVEQIIKEMNATLTDEVRADHVKALAEK